MNWPPNTFDWTQLKAFLATVEEGSLSAAARILGLTQPTLGRQINALEEHLDVVLFERVGRRLVPTPTGLALVDHARAMRDAANAVSLIASAHSDAVEGHVVISASGGFSAYLLPQIMVGLRTRLPGITIELIATDSISDLQHREADIAIRHVRPTEPELIARLVAETEGRLYAATAYLDRIGRPTSLSDLNTADFIGYDRSDRMIEVLNGLGLSLTHKNFPVLSDSGVAGWEMVKCGLGIGANVTQIGAQTPGVEEALPGMEFVPVPVWLTTHRELHTNRRIRMVYDHLAEALAALTVQP